MSLEINLHHLSISNPSRASCPNFVPTLHSNCSLLFLSVSHTEWNHSASLKGFHIAASRFDGEKSHGTRYSIHGIEITLSYVQQSKVHSYCSMDATSWAWPSSITIRLAFIGQNAAIVKSTSDTIVFIRNMAAHYRVHTLHGNQSNFSVRLPRSISQSSPLPPSLHWLESFTFADKAESSMFHAFLSGF